MHTQYCDSSLNMNIESLSNISCDTSLNMNIESPLQNQVFLQKHLRESILHESQPPGQLVRAQILDLG